MINYYSGRIDHFLPARRVGLPRGAAGFFPLLLSSYHLVVSLTVIFFFLLLTKLLLLGSNICLFLVYFLKVFLIAELCGWQATSNKHYYLPTPILLKPQTDKPVNPKFSTKCSPQVRDDRIPPHEQGTFSANPNQIQAT